MGAAASVGVGAAIRASNSADLRSALAAFPDDGREKLVVAVASCVHGLEADEQASARTNEDCNNHLWWIRLFTLNGQMAEISVSHDITVEALLMKAADSFDMKHQHLILMHGEIVLSETTSKLVKNALTDEAEVIVIVRGLRTQFLQLLCPKDWDDPGIELSAQEGSDDLVVASFKRSHGYRCAVAEALPPHGVHIVSFDFIEYARVGTYNVAFGLHANPVQMRSGPLNDHGWIGETAGGICISDNGGVVKYNGSQVGLYSELNMGNLNSGLTVSFTLDHGLQTLTWTVCLGKDKDITSFSMALPSDLVGRELWPAISKTSSGDFMVRIRLDRPLPRWRCGNDPVPQA